MFSKRYVTSFIVACLLGVVGVAQQANAVTTVPTLMHFQGRLTDTANAVKADGTYNIRFRLYDAGSGGTLKWSEDRLVSAGQGIVLINGLFTTKLGQVTPLPASIFSSGSLYLEVELPTPASATTTSPVWTEGAMTPRNVLATSAYAYNTDLLDGMDSSAFVSTAANNILTGTNIFRPTTNSTTAFQIQNSTSQSLLVADTTGAGAITLFSGNDLTRGAPGAWQAAANTLPAVRYNSTSVNANGYMYVIGGDDGGTAQSTVYYAKLNADGSVGAWQTSTALPAGGRIGHSSVIANGYLYVIGGTDGDVQSTVYYAKLNADGSVGTWQTAANALPAVRFGHSSVVSGGYVYVLGGSNGTAIQSTVYYAKLNADGSVGTWQTASALTTVRYIHSSVVAGGYVYVVGGTDGAAQSTVYYAKLNADGSVGTWQTAANAVPASRYGHTSVVSNGYVYVVGGYGSTLPQSTVYYAKLNADGSVGAWQTAANALPAVRAFHNSLIANGYVYAMGGHTGASPQSTVYYSRLGGVTRLGGSLDLVGLQGGTLADSGDASTGSTGGSLTAGNITAVGTLQVQGQSLFNDSVSVARDFTVGNNLLSVDDNNAGTVTLLGNGSGELQEWRTAVGMTNPRLDTVSLTANGYVYVIGGWNGSASVSTVEVSKILADGTLSTFTTLTSLPEFRSGASGAIANGYLYVIGGNGPSGPSATAYYAKLNSDGTLGSWQQSTTSFTTGRYYHSSVVVDGYVYVIGGFNGGALSTIYYAKLNSDGSIGMWQQETTNPLAAPLSDGEVARVGRTIYLVGGDNSGAVSTVQKTTVNANGSLSAWTSLTSLPVGVRSASAVVANGYLYLIGGYKTTYSDDVYYAKIKQDGTLGDWVAVQNRLPAGIAYLNSFVANGYVYIVGGQSSGPTVVDKVRRAALSGRVNIGGSLDLVGLQGGTLADAGASSTGSSGGSLTAGSITAAGTLQVQGAALFADAVSINSEFNAGNGIFAVSAASSTVQIGPTAPDAIGTVLVLDSSSGGDPSGTNGATYYNTTSGKFRCYQTGAWVDCSDGYTVGVRAISTNPAASTTYTFSNTLRAFTTTSSKLYIRKAGTLKIAELYTQATGTAGSGEAWSFYIRLNNTTDYLVATQSVAGAERVFSNTGLSLVLQEGDYVEIKTTTPAWATPPTGVVVGGYLYID